MVLKTFSPSDYYRTFIPAMIYDIKLLGTITLITKKS